ncbi:unnamed protein product [Meganyctiphanes norvegica]|uniref:Uncharacterized protein n=1 Tax=Meganyctiphanes norvegica TaxID=48144 RepID=A0AAV2QQ67_MEGNR
MDVTDVPEVQTSSTPLLAAAANVASSLDTAVDLFIKLSPKSSRRKLTIAHLDKPLQGKSADSMKVSMSPEQQEISRGSRLYDRYVHPPNVSPLSHDGHKSWSEMAVKPFTETSAAQSSNTKSKHYSTEGGIFRNFSEVDSSRSTSKAIDGSKNISTSPDTLPFFSPLFRSSLSPSSSTSSKSSSSVRDKGKEESLCKSPLLSSPTTSSSSSESRSSSQFALSLFGKDSSDKSFSLDMFKINRSESSLPLLSPDEHRPSHGTFAETKLIEKCDKKTRRVTLETEVSKCDLRQQSSEEKDIKFSTDSKPDSPVVSKREPLISAMKVRTEEKQKESVPTKKVCHLCERENEKRKKMKEKELGLKFGPRDLHVSSTSKRRHNENSVSANKSLIDRRKTLKSQGSLDSAREKQATSKSPSPLTRSGSLDLDKAEFLQRELSHEASLSTSQDSLQSDMGGAPTLHRYYHVFREGELDQLIERYVHNLHIISSYYDHANWCVIAEKVQVWTI